MLLVWILILSPPFVMEKIPWFLPADCICALYKCPRFETDVLMRLGGPKVRELTSQYGGKKPPGLAEYVASFFNFAISSRPPYMKWTKDSWPEVWMLRFFAPDKECSDRFVIDPGGTGSPTIYIAWPFEQPGHPLAINAPLLCDMEISEGALKYGDGLMNTLEKLLAQDEREHVLETAVLNAGSPERVEMDEVIKGIDRDLVIGNKLPSGFSIQLNGSIYTGQTSFHGGNALHVEAGWHKESVEAEYVDSYPDGHYIHDYPCIDGCP